MKVGYFGVDVDQVGGGDQGWTSGCVVAGPPGRIWCQSLSSTTAPGKPREQHN